MSQAPPPSKAALKIQPKAKAAPSPSKPKEHDVDQLPAEFKDREFSYRFHDRVGPPIPIEEIFGLVKLMANDHPLRSELGKLKFAPKLELKGRSFPSHHNLGRHVKEVLNQGNIGACVAHSAVQALHIIMERYESERYTLGKLMFKSTYNNFRGSRLYLYDQARRLDGTPLSEDSGTTNYSACKALAEYKICSEKTWPYTKDNVYRMPPHEAYVEAKQFKKFEYSRVERDVDAFKSALYSGSPIMIGIVVFPSFVHSGVSGGSGDAPMPKEEYEKAMGGHFILVVGYDDDRKRFICLNHWSSSWGKQGFCTLPYDFVMNERYAGDFFAIEKFE